ALHGERTPPPGRSSSPLSMATIRHQNWGRYPTNADESVQTSFSITSLVDIAHTRNYIKRRRITFGRTGCTNLSEEVLIAHHLPDRHADRIDRQDPEEHRQPVLQSRKVVDDGLIIQNYDIKIERVAQRERTLGKISETIIILRRCNHSHPLARQDECLQALGNNGVSRSDAIRTRIRAEHVAKYRRARLSQIPP